MVISKTPLRISFAGGGTDLPSFYRHHDYGAVISTSIDSYIYVTIKRHSRLFSEKYRLNYSSTEQVDEIDKIEHPIIRECLRFLDIDEKLYISTIADAPGSSGLGSSSSFCVGLLNALYKFKGQSISAGRLAEEAAHIEIDILQRPMGKQDHYAAAYGGVNYLRFNKDETVTLQHVACRTRNTEVLFGSLLSFWTGVVRPSESVLKEQDANNNKNSDILIQMRDHAAELLYLLDSNKFSIERFARIVHEGWLLKTQLASNISNSRIDKAYALALENGALGGKISGAGGGGFLNIFAHEENHERLISVLAPIGLSRYKMNIDSNGTQVNIIA
ncbi:GHMP kinase [bacterium]|nr:MAG: GHMP kinase [bacterium]